MHKVRDPLSGRWERRGRDKNPRAGRGNWKQPWDVGTRRARGKLEDAVTISRTEGAPGRDPGQAETLGGERGRPKDTWGPPTSEAGTLQGLLGKGGDLQSQSRWDIPGKEGNPPTMGATGTSPSSWDSPGTGRGFHPRGPPPNRNNLTVPVSPIPSFKGNGALRGPPPGPPRSGARPCVCQGLSQGCLGSSNRRARDTPPLREQMAVLGDEQDTGEMEHAEPSSPGVRVEVTAGRERSLGSGRNLNPHRQRGQGQAGSRTPGTRDTPLKDRICHRQGSPGDRQRPRLPGHLLEQRETNPRWSRG